MAHRSSAADADPSYDHVVLISLDTLRSDGIAASPDPLWPADHPRLAAPDTGVLDDLARSGAFFSNVISAAPHTGPSHGTMFTGRFPIAHGVHEFYNGRISVPTVFTHGKRAGRRTIMKVDFPIILGPQLGFTRDVDDYLVEDDDGFIDAVLAAESSVAFAHFGGIHMPYGFHNLRYGGDDYRRKVVELEQEVPPDVPLPVDQLTETYRDPEDEHLLLRYKRAYHHLYECGRYERIFELYLEGIGYFVGRRLAPFLDRLLSGLRARGRTFLLVLFSDHGHQIDADSLGNFNTVAEGVLRVPMIFVGEGVEPAIHRQRIRSVDLLPTLADLVGFERVVGCPYDGRSLAGVVRGEESLAGDAPAVAQAYTSDAGEFVEHQRRQLAGEEPEPLRHVLLTEAAYLDDHRLTRTHHRYVDSFSRLEAIEPQEVMEVFDAHRRPVVTTEGDPTLLGRMLDDYNALRSPPQPVAASASVRAALRGMGYRV